MLCVTAWLAMPFSVSDPLGVQQVALSWEPVETVGGEVLLEEIGNSF